MKSGALIAALGLLIASPAWAQDDDTGPAMITGIWTHECDDVEPTPLTFDQAMTLPRDQIPECVAVDGLWDWRMFYRDLDGYYERTQGWSGEASPARLGVYSPPDMEGPDRLTVSRLIGKVADCKDIEPDIWMGGYCHYFPGRFIMLGWAEPTGSVPQRWMGAEARRRIGELVDPPADWPHFAYVRGVAETWLTLLRAGDATAYLDGIPANDFFADEVDHPGTPEHAMFRDDHSVFARLRAQDEISPPRIWMLPVFETPEYPMGADEVYALVCYRVGDWVDDRWPVSSRDAGNGPERPYACLLVTRDSSVERVDVALGSGLAEPPLD